MTALTPPAWQQAGSYSARVDRLSALSAVLQYPGLSSRASSPVSIADGVKPSYQNSRLAVTAQGTPNMSVQLTSGWAYVQNDDIAAYGAYVVVNDGTITIPIGASSGSQYRIDTVVAKVLDAETLGSSNSASFEVVSGAYAASRAAATRGTIPPNAAILADVYVDAGITSVTNALIADARTYTVASGGIQPVTSTTDLDNGAPGQVRYRMDTDTFTYTNLAGVTKNLLQSAGASAIGQYQTAIKPVSGDTARTATTLVDDPHLTLPVVANAVYELSGVFFFNGATGGDFRQQFSVPSGSAYRLSMTGQDLNATVSVGSVITDQQSGAQSWGTIGTGSNMTVRYTGILRTGGTAGNITLQWGLNAASGTTTLTQDSHMNLRRIS